MPENPENIGAGEGNRTLVFSLEGCCSTIELHPRALRELTRRAPALNRPGSAICGKRPPFRQARDHAARPLTRAESVPILGFPPTQRKEVIQCLVPSAVTSLGSPARLLSRLRNWAFSAPGPARYKSWDATGAIPSRLFLLPGCADRTRVYPGSALSMIQVGNCRLGWRRPANP